MKLWKVLGVAGIAGVAATGVAVARSERRRRSYRPDDVRSRLHQRHAEALQVDASLPDEPQAGDHALPPGGLRRRWAALAARVAGRRAR